MDWFRQWTSDLAFPLLPDSTSYDVFLAMRRHPRFDSTKRFEFRPHAEFHMTNDKSLWSHTQGPGEGLIPVLSSAAFDIWNPDTGYPFGYVPKDTALKVLRSKLKRQVRTSSSPFFGLSPEKLAKLPLEKARIAFSSRARSTDLRTMTSCLVPPNVALSHAAPYLLQRSGDTSDEAYLLGVLSSIPFDWYARKFVDQNFSFFFFAPMPIPRPSQDDPLRHRAIDIAGRLAAVDERYSEWAKEVGVPVGSVKTKDEKDDLIAELDAVVAHLYGLAEAQLAHIFETFHVGWDYRDRLDATLSHFRSWNSK